MRTIILLAAFMGVAMLARSQTLSPDLTGTGGDSHQQTPYRIDWSAGEVVTESFEAGNYILTQGFQQTQGNPLVKAIMSPSGSGDFGTGQIIEITLEFTTEMELNGGSINVKLSNGGLIIISKIDPIDPTKARGKYTVSVSDEDFKNLNISSISLQNGAELYGINGLPVLPDQDNRLTIPKGNNLADNENINIDKTGPENIPKECFDRGSGNINLLFTEAFVTERKNKKRGIKDLQVTDLIISITGGTATLGTPKLIKVNDVLYYLNLDLQGIPDGNETVNIRMKNGSSIIDLQGNIGQFNPLQIAIQPPPAVPLSPWGIAIVFGLIVLVSIKSKV